MTLALGYVSAELQHIFISFIMVFPTLLVLLFFGTLNWNHRVLYAPSDFREDASFLNALVRSRASGNIIEVKSGIDMALKVVEETISQRGELTEERVKALEDVLKESKASASIALEQLQPKVTRGSNPFLEVLVDFMENQNKPRLTMDEIVGLFPTYGPSYVALRMDEFVHRKYSIEIPTLARLC